MTEVINKKRMSLEFLHFVASTVAVSALITHILQAVEIRSINNTDRFHTCNHIIHDAAPPAVLQCAPADLALRNDVVADVHPMRGKLETETPAPRPRAFNGELLNPRTPWELLENAS